MKHEDSSDIGLQSDLQDLAADHMTGLQDKQTLHPLRNRSIKHRAPWLAVPFVLGLLSLLTAGYLWTFTSATIVDQSGPAAAAVAVPIRTHQSTVGAALREAGINVQPEDIVSPALDQPLKHNGQIHIQRAKLVRLQVDGQDPQLLRTQRSTGQEVLVDLGIQPNVNDFLSVNGGSANQPILPTGTDPKDLAGRLEKPVADLFFRKAVPMTVIDRATNSPITFRTSAKTVGEALMQAGNLIYLADRVSPAPNTPVQPNMQVVIERAKPISVVVDGRRIRTRTHQATVGQLLAEMNIVLFDQDYARPALETAVTPDTEVRVVRVTHAVEVQQDYIPFDSRWEADPDVEIDNEFVGQEGRPGVREVRTLVSYEDGNEVKREVVADFTARDPQPKIMKYGTKIVLRTLDTPSGPVTYWRKLRMLATSYSASTAGVSRSAAWYGKVRCGYEMRRGVVAVDPNVVSLNTMVYVPNYGVGHACDTGSAIKGMRVDLGYGDTDLELWYRWTDVYLLSPAPSPDEIDYRLGK